MPDAQGMKLILYDRTCRGTAGIGLSHAWRGGTQLYRALGRCDGSFGAASFSEGLSWLARYRPTRPISEVQYWGHGKWGRLFIAGEPFGRAAFAATHPHHRELSALRARLTGGALLWFRTCETFGAESGLAFAQNCADFFGCAVAGHTFIIGYWQSGLCRLEPGRTPNWSASEGLLEGSPHAPRKADSSGPRKPRTITCLTGRVPSTW
jgi:hypothetical protein